MSFSFFLSLFSFASLWFIFLPLWFCLWVFFHYCWSMFPFPDHSQFSKLLASKFLFILSSWISFVSISLDSWLLSNLFSWFSFYYYFSLHLIISFIHSFDDPWVFLSFPWNSDLYLSSFTFNFYPFCLCVLSLSFQNSIVFSYPWWLSFFYSFSTSSLLTFLSVCLSEFCFDPFLSFIILIILEFSLLFPLGSDSYLLQFTSKLILIGSPYHICISKTPLAVDFPCWSSIFYLFSFFQFSLLELLHF